MKKLSLLAVLILAACTTAYTQEEIANRLASPAWMIQRQIPAGAFSLTAYERIHDERGDFADVYIEGDGKAWTSRTEISRNPTPSNPVALHMATRDDAENVIYLARPCQYGGFFNNGRPCDRSYWTYWTDKRFAPEVISAYNAALNEIKARYGIKGFNLIGFSGGGAIAAILSAQRDDVLTLRTVAGNLDHKVHSAYHKVAPLTGSLNPPDFAPRLRAVPQIHFVGGQDEIVPPAVVQSYLQALGPNNCAQSQLIQESTHDKGWVDKWPELLKIRPSCAGQVEGEPAFDPMPPEVDNFYTSPEQPEKP
jgi:hypothetical protein